MRPPSDRIVPVGSDEEGSLTQYTARFWRYMLLEAWDRVEPTK